MRPGQAAATRRTATSQDSRRDSRLGGQETRNQAVVARLAQLVSQRDRALVEAGRSLHDDLGQILTASGIQFELMAQEVSEKHPDLAEKLHSLQALLEECQVRTRVISRQMQRSTVDRLGLKSALERIRDRWEPGFSGFISLECEANVRPPASVARAMAALVEHALELACNRSGCTYAGIQVTEMRPAGYQAMVALEGLTDPFQNIEEEVRWHVVRGSCQIAGGEAHIEVSTVDNNRAILIAQFC